MNLDKGRPENKLPPQLYYNRTQSRKYTQNSRIIKIQQDMTERAVQLLNLSPSETNPLLLLDIGCGSGISGDVLSNHSIYWIGVDISIDMLNICKTKKMMCLGDTLVDDMGQGLPFRVGVFDGAISISALQWLCTNYNKLEKPIERMNVFFRNLYMCLKRGGKAVFQFYPENTKQINLINKAALNAGFSGGVVIDYPNSTKARKYYLVLFAGHVKEELPKGLTGTGVKERDSIIHYKERVNERKGKYKKKNRKSLKEWVVKKKVRDRFRGKKTASDSKYTARKRRPKF